MGHVDGTMALLLPITNTLQSWETWMNATGVWASLLNTPREHIIISLQVRSRSSRVLSAEHPKNHSRAEDLHPAAVLLADDRLRRAAGLLRAAIK